MEINSLEVEQPRVTRPLYSDEQIPEAKFATSGHLSASEQVQPPKNTNKAGSKAASLVSESRAGSVKGGAGGYINSRSSRLAAGMPLVTDNWASKPNATKPRQAEDRQLKRGQKGETEQLVEAAGVGRLPRDAG
jgi:hypothetical protein